MANACERVIETIRECLDFLIPINERHLARIIRELALITIAAGHILRRPGLPRTEPSFSSRQTPST